MKNLIATCIFFCFPLFLLGQENNYGIEILDINYSDLSKIILIDKAKERNTRTWCRVYEIDLNRDSIPLYQIQEYIKTPVFKTDLKKYRQSAEELESDSIMKEYFIQRAITINKRINESTRRSDSIFRVKTNMRDNWKGKEFIKNIEKSRVEDLLKEVNSTCKTPFKYFEENGIDSVWLSQNKNRLAKAYLNGKRKTKPYHFEFYRNQFSDLKRLKWDFTYLIMDDCMPGSYTHIEMQLVLKSRDTIRINSEGEGLFLVPWDMNGNYRTLNTMLPVKIAALLPDKKHCSNKTQLSPEWSLLEEYLYEWVNNERVHIDKEKWKKIARENRKKARKNDKTNK